MRGRLRGLLLGVLPAVGLLVASASGLLAVTAVPAGAHTELVGSSPAPGATVRTGLHSVTLDFEEPPSTRLLQVAVIGPDGRDLVAGAPRLLGARVVADVRRPTEPGPYEISYRVAAADDHPETGSIRFTLSREGVASAVPSTGERPGSGPVGAVSPAFRQKRRGAPPPGDGLLPWASLGIVLLGLGLSVPLARRAARSADPARSS